MKAHATRRSLWLLNVLLMAGVVGVGAWYALDVRKAVAAAPVPDKRTRKPPKKWVDINSAFNKEIRDARTFDVKPPVDRERLESVLLNPQFPKMLPPHFIFTGPPPSGIFETAKPDVPVENLPTGLDKEGAITWMIYAGNDSTIAFRFKGAEADKYFSIGQYVKPKADGFNRFKLVSAEQVESGYYKVHYEVYDRGKDEPVNKLTLDYDRRPKANPDGVIRAKPKPEPAATPTGDGTPGGAPGEASAGGGTKPPQPVVIGGDPQPVPEVRIQDLKPEIVRRSANVIDINFDDNSANYFKGRTAEKLVESVKTRVRELPGGQSGVEVLDAGEAPIDKFNIKRGDVIVSINGMPTPDRESIIRVAKSIPETTTRVSVVVDRNGRKLTFNVDPRDPKTRRRAAQIGGDSLRRAEGR
jgi:hypothetical protein